MDKNSLAQRLQEPNTAANIDPPQRLTDLLAETSELAEICASSACVQNLLARVFTGSPFLTRFAERYPEEIANFLAIDPDEHLDNLLNSADQALKTETDFAKASAILRIARTKAAVLVALADLGGVWPVPRVIEAQSEIARRLVASAVRFLLSSAALRGKIHPKDPDHPDIASGYIVLAMGKLGAGELNYSSDIDLIVLFDPAIAPVDQGEDMRSFFVRLTRDMVKLLQEHTGDGYVFRTDLRLRPDPGATNVALSTDAAMQYYESFGQNWERAAMIKASPIAGDLAAGEEFLAEIKPFIWRKYLDFAAIADVHSIKRQIQAYRGHADVAVAGHNIKLGRGGIREVEFFVQTQQLIAGGRNADLRGQKTLDMLNVLAGEQWITEEGRDEMSAAYIYLRWLENRIQMVGDQQTQTLSSDADELQTFALFAGYKDAEALAADLTQHLRRVEAHYTSLFEHAPNLGHSGGPLAFTGGEDDPATLQTLSDMGFTDVKLVSRTVRDWHHGRYSATRTQAARGRLTELMPALLQALADSEHPDKACIAFDRFLERLPSGVQLFSMLHANEQLLSLLADIMGTAPRLANELSLRPRTLEGVLSPDFYGPLPDETAYALASSDAIAEASNPDDFNVEECLDRVRAFGQEQFFRIGVRLLSGTIEADEAGRANSALASGLISTLLPVVAAQIAQGAGEFPGGEVVVIGMGKLGGGEMSASSDLDLILVYDLDEGASQSVIDESAGQRSLSVGQYFTRFTQRFISALSAPTAEGRLYDVDMRLRPSGNAGPVATRLTAFVDYHATSSWTWEHMALTRARVVAGPKKLKQTVESAIRDRLVAPRAKIALAEDVRSMRARIEEERGSDKLWDIKQVRGGLIDIEFLLQYLQLAHAAENPDILSPNAETATERLFEAGFIEANEREVIQGALSLYMTVTQMVRLCLGQNSDPENASASFRRRLAQAVNVPQFEHVVAELGHCQKEVSQIYQRYLAE